MKKFILLFALLIFGWGVSQQVPKVLKTKFSKEALAQKVTDINGKTISISKILEQNKGKIVVLDLWASWCRDCIQSMPKAKELEDKNPNVKFIFLSLDRNEEAWKKGIRKT